MSTFYLRTHSSHVFQVSKSILIELKIGYFSYLHPLVGRCRPNGSGVMAVQSCIGNQKCTPRPIFQKNHIGGHFFWRQARNLTQTHPSNFPIGSRTLFFSYLDKKCPKWPKKQSKKRPKIGHHNICELITPKLSQISASNWLSIYYYRTSLSTFNSNLLASCILCQSQPEFGPPKNCEKLH